MLQHRLIDKAKRQGSWVAKLRQTAQYAIETTPPDQFSSAREAGFGKRMKERALHDILPNLFETAALYEDHFARYELYEGTGRTDPGYGTHVKWHRLTRPPRQAAPPRKRGRQSKAARAPRMESDDDASGGESEVDDTMTRAHLQRTRQARSQAQQPQNPSVLVSRQHAPDTPAPTVPAGASAPSTSQQDPHVLSSTTSNISFGQHMYGLRLNEEMDAKMPSHARHNDQVLVQNMYPSNMLMQYPASHAGYNFPVFQHQEDAHSFPHSTESSFGSHVPGFAHSFSVSNAPCPSQDDRFAVPMASINAGFPYEYEGASPLTPMSGDSNRPFHGLPLDPNANY
jgi:hypothetical protein